MKVNNHDDAVDVQTRLLNIVTSGIKSPHDPRLGLRSMALTSQIYLNMYAKHPDRTHEDVKKEVDGILNKLAMTGALPRMLSNLLQVELDTLANGDTVYVSPEVCEEIIEASETMIDNVIIPQDVFSTNCLIVLGTPFEYVIPQLQATDEYEEVWSVQAIGLTTPSINSDIHEAGEPSDGLILHMYGSLRSVSKQMPDGSVETAEFIDSNSLRFTAKGESTVLTRKQANHVMGGNIGLFMDRFANQIDFIDTTALKFFRDNDGYCDRIIKIKKFLIALFRLSDEYLEKADVVTSKPFRKRAIRAGRTAPLAGYVTTLRLRRVAGYNDSNDGTGAGVSYSFRVRGHWKRAYMRSRGFPVGDPRSYKHVYVKDYIKGKSHGDVVESHRVIRMDR